MEKKEENIVGISNPRLEADEFDFYGDEELVEISANKIGKLDEPKVIPSYTRKEYDESTEELDIKNVDAGDVETRTTIAINENGKDFVNPDDIGVRKYSPKIDNKPIVNGATLFMKELGLKKRAKSTTAGLMKLSKMSGLGGMIHIPMWHSGFWITFKPLTDLDITNLELELVDELTRIGRDTTTLVFSNHNVIFAEIIMKYFKQNIHSTTLKLEDGDDIFNYMDVRDLYIAAISMARGMYPRGFNAIIPCKNTIKLNDKKVPVCNYKAHVKIRLEDIIWVDFDKLDMESIDEETFNHKEHMANKTPNSMDTETVVKYQETLPFGGEESLVIREPETGEEYTIVFKTPNVTKYIEIGRYFISELKDAAVNIVKNNKDITSEADAEKIIVKSIYLQTYAQYVNKIIIEDSNLSTVGAIFEALEIIGSNLEVENLFMDAIKKYIDESIIAIVGVPNFVCPTCKTKQVSDEIIPLSVYEYFFSLLHSRYEKILAKMS